MVITGRVLNAYLTENDRLIFKRRRWQRPRDEPACSHSR